MPVSTSPRVTVYITNHNYANYLGRAVDSVLSQTLDNFELIVIDDGSTDNSRELIEKYAENDKVITIFQHNKGLNVTNNIALRAARGDYIMRLDADDWLDVHALEVLGGALDRDPDLGLVFPDYYLVDEAGEVLEAVRRHDFDNVTLHDQPAHGACTMIRRSFLLEIDGYDENFRCQDGYDLWIRFIKHFKVQNINLPLFYYRQHEASLTRDENRILDTRAEIIKRQAKLDRQKISALAIIPVRGPAANPSSVALTPLGGKYLIDWTIQEALEADCIKDVIVTTPDAAIIKHVDNVFGGTVICVERDSKLARPNTYIEGALLDAMETYGRNNDLPDTIVHLSIRSPFRTARHINTAVDMLHLFETDTVIAVRPETDIFFQHDGNGLVPVRKVSRLQLEREGIFREVGGLRVIRREFLEKEKSNLGGRIGHVILDQKAALNLNSELDWKTAESLVSEHQTNA